MCMKIVSGLIKKEMSRAMEMSSSIEGKNEIIQLKLQGEAEWNVNMHGRIKQRC